jgi:glycosyltransferase involved in cell wall biosynthesis
VLHDRDIIVFGDDWGHYPSTMQHLGRVLSQHNRLMWVGSLGLRRPKVSLYDIIRAGKKLQNLLKGRDETGETITQVHPPVIPFHDSVMVRRLNERNIRTTLQKGMRRLGFSKPIVFSSSPLVGSLVGCFGETSSHYICLDDWSGFDRAFSCLLEEERKLLDKVDSCMAVSERLVQTRVPASGRVFYLPQGVDVDHFSRKNIPLPPRVASLPRPIVGFFGLLASFTNLELLATAARRHPDKSFVVLGRRAVDISAIQNIPNLHYLGEVPYEELPDYARSFDIGLIPFVINDLTTAANPLKALEYLALGIPVVSTDIPAVHRFQPMVHIAQDNDHFVELIGHALRSCGEEMARACTWQAAQFSWTRVVENVSDRVQEIEKEKARIRQLTTSGMAR